MDKQYVRVGDLETKHKS